MNTVEDFWKTAKLTLIKYRENAHDDAYILGNNDEVI